MIRRLMVLLLIAFAVATPGHADQRSAAQARFALDTLLQSTTDLTKEAQRDGEILRLLREASRNLDNWQPNTAISKALDNIGKAQQLAGASSQRVQEAVLAAKQIVEPAKESPSSADLPKIREQLRARPIEQMREVVANEISLLARLATQVSDISGLITKAVASASATTLGVKGD